MANLDSSYLEMARANGKAWRLSIFRQTVAITGCAKLRIENPVGSGKKVIFYSAALFSAVSTVANMTSFSAVTSNAPTTNPIAAGSGAVRNMNTAFAGTSPVAKVYFDTGVLLTAGMVGTRVDDIPLLTNNNIIIDNFALELAPGSSIYIQWSGAVASDFAYRIYWIEL